MEKQKIFLAKKKKSFITKFVNFSGYLDNEFQNSGNTEKLDRLRGKMVEARDVYQTAIKDRVEALQAEMDELGVEAWKMRDIGQRNNYIYNKEEYWPEIVKGEDEYTDKYFERGEKRVQDRWAKKMGFNSHEEYQARLDEIRAKNQTEEA